MVQHGISYKQATKCVRFLLLPWVAANLLLKIFSRGSSNGCFFIWWCGMRWLFCLFVSLYEVTFTRSVLQGLLAWTLMLRWEVEYSWLLLKDGISWRTCYKMVERGCYWNRSFGWRLLPIWIAASTCGNFVRKLVLNLMGRMLAIWEKACFRGTISALKSLSPASFPSLWSLPFSPCRSPFTSPCRLLPVMLLLRSSPAIYIFDSL